MIPPSVFPLPSFGAFVVVALAARAFADLTSEMELHVARGELSFG